jgi:hypothetical protein
MRRGRRKKKEPHSHKVQEQTKERKKVRPGHRYRSIEWYEKATEEMQEELMNFASDLGTS